MPLTFLEAVEFVLAREGGYSFDDDDPGGETNFGISRRAYPDLNIKHLTKQEAIGIYFRDYWKKMGCELLPPNLAIALFDSAVNIGRGQTTRWVQGALNSMGEGLDVDGDLGPKTMKSLLSKNHTHILWLVTRDRVGHYYNLGKRHPKFLRGWVGRVYDLMTFVGNPV